MTDAPEYADPQRYAELAGFDGEYRDLWWNRDYLDLLARRWRLGERREALDVGCGAGHWSLTVLAGMAEGARLTGVDAEPAFCELARERARSRDLGERCRFVEGRAEALPFADASFDVVTCQTVLMHVADAGVAIAEMIRVLRPGGVLICCEPDNLAGDLALLGSSLETPDEDTVEIVRFVQRCLRGKRALGEGDERVGHRLPGLFAAAGLTEIESYVNDRCMQLIPPYVDPRMRTAIDQELIWARDGVSILVGTRHDVTRIHRAGGGSQADFDAGWEACQRWRVGFIEAVEAGQFTAARGFVLYVVSGTKPG